MLGGEGRERPLMTVREHRGKGYHMRYVYVVMKGEYGVAVFDSEEAAEAIQERIDHSYISKLPYYGNIPVIVAGDAE